MRIGEIRLYGALACFIVAALLVWLAATQDGGWLSAWDLLCAASWSWLAWQFGSLRVIDVGARPLTIVRKERGQ